MDSAFAIKNSNIPVNSSIKSEYAENAEWNAVTARRVDEINGGIPDHYIVPEHVVKRDGIIITKASGVLSARELEIIELSATTLLMRIHSQEYTSVEVTTAYCKSAALAHQVVGS